MRLQNMALLLHCVLFLELKEKSIQNSSDDFMQMQSNKRKKAFHIILFLNKRTGCKRSKRRPISKV